MSYGHEWTEHEGRFEHLAIGSYDYIIGMDWLDQHHALLDYHKKAFNFLDEEGN